MVKRVTEKRRRRKQKGQIFVNASGGRRQLLALAALAVGCACVGYLLLLVAALSGVLWQDGQEPPKTAERSTTGSAPTAEPWPSSYTYGTAVTDPLAADSPSGGGPW
ncbi:predicted protein [Streptomyces iranensis]|uniref:Uncharacterized protein n=1 Tax=Streptomyces iranensis TaxID=576784 RepID=A0A060ZSM6_9ACTN|nr:predicted protein [Streptomyces iranensis]